MSSIYLNGLINRVRVYILLILELTVLGDHFLRGNAVVDDTYRDYQNIWMLTLASNMSFKH